MRLLSLLFEEQETGQVWNDWATIKIACGEIAAVRTGYEKALALDANNSQAQFNWAGEVLQNENI